MISIFNASYHFSELYCLIHFFTDFIFKAIMTPFIIPEFSASTGLVSFCPFFADILYIYLPTSASRILNLCQAYDVDNEESWN